MNKLSSHSVLAFGLMMAASVGADCPLPSRAVRARDHMPRPFTDARKAEAEAKRQRKAAKRLKGLRQ